MSITPSLGSWNTQGPDAAHGRWRVPVGLLLAAVSLPLALWYGYGTVAAIAALIVVAPARQGSALAWAAVALAGVGLLVGAFMLVAAVGLCGPGILVGRCSA